MNVNAVKEPKANIQSIYYAQELHWAATCVEWDDYAFHEI